MVFSGPPSLHEIIRLLTRKIDKTRTNRALMPEGYVKPMIFMISVLIISVENSQPYTPYFY